MPPAATPLWMWLELAICFGATVIRVPFAMFFFIGYAMSGVLFGDELSAQSRWGAIYGAGALWGLVAVWILIATRFGDSRFRWVLWLVRVGMVVGLIVVAVIPEGRLPSVRIASPELLFELFCSLLPSLCFLHVGYLGRSYLIGGVRTRPSV